MKRIKLYVAAILTALSAFSQTPSEVNRPDAGGYLLRGELLEGVGLYGAAVDQLTTAATLDPDPRQGEDILWLSAIAALRRGDDNTLRLLEKYIAEYPGSARIPLARVAVGDWYYGSGDYRRALETWGAVDLSTLAPAARTGLSYRLACSRLMTGDLAAAERGFAGLRGDRRYGNASRFYLGYIAYTKKDYTAAKKYFRETDRNSAPANAVPAFMAEILYTEKDWDGALKEARSVLADRSLEGYSVEARRIAGESLWQLGRRSEALDYLWKYAAEAESPAPSAFYILGISEYEAGRYKESIGLLQKAVADPSPMTQSAMLYLGQSYSMTGNTNSALLAFEKSYRMDLNPQVTEAAFYNYVVTKLNGGQMPFDSSVGLLEDFLRRFPDSAYGPEIGQYLVDTYIRENDFESALETIARIKNPSKEMVASRQRAEFMLGTREYANGKRRSALERFVSAASGPDQSIARQSILWQGDCQYQLGQYDAAVRSYTRFINHSPRDGENLSLARYDLGYALFALDRYDEVAREFREYLSTASGITPATRADVLSRLGDCAYYTGDYAAAETLYSDALEANRRTGDYPLYQMALMKGLRRDHSGKIEAIDRLSRDYPGSGLLAAALLAKAESQSATGDNSGALATLSSVVAKYPATLQGRKAALQLAITQADLGRRDEAVGAYRQVITTWPTSEEARLAADDLKRIYADQGRLGEFTDFLTSVPNAPAIEPSEYDALTFEAAEKAYSSGDDTSRLEAYLKEYPSGAFVDNALYCLASAADAEGNPRRALELASRLLDANPDSEYAEDALLLKGSAEAELGRDRDALATYTVLERRASGSEFQREARLGIMRLALRLGHYDELLSVTERLAATSAAGESDRAEIGYSRGQALDRLGRHDEADRTWSEVIASFPGEQFASQSAVALAESRLDRKQLKKARSGIEEFVSSNPPQQYWLARGFIVLSDILRAQGNTFEADEYLKTLRNNYPGSEQDIFQMIDQRLR
ncbi:MAG: tetratricopeptide repeat protein [Clostridium sp.]|nr:tetratricopeptide repeat protein [Clostridium sp.]